MYERVSVSELRAHCVRIVEGVAKRGREVVITKRGKRVARIVPIEEQPSDGAVDRLRGTLLQGFALSDFETGAPWRSARR